MNRYIKRAKNGMALVSVLIITAFVMIIVTIVLSIMQYQTSSNTKFITHIDGLQYAEAGINQFLWAINKNEISSIDTTGTPIAYSDGFYSIEILSSGDSAYRVKATGWLKENAKRAIEVTLTKRTFTQYAYFSDNEGDTIWWMDDDVIYGPMHTNSIFRIYGDPTFYGPVTHADDIIFYQNTVRNTYTGAVGTNDPDFVSGITRSSALLFPDSNSELLARANQNGYVYTGRTSILLNANGTITTRNANRNSGNPETRSLPANGVLYVNGSKDNSFQRPSSHKFDLAYGNAFVSGVLNGRLTIAAADCIYITGKDPTNYVYNNAQNYGGITYASTGFSLNTTTGAVSVSGSAQDDMLGLIANNCVWILAFGWFS